ncbi:MAG TPA: response regulator transcription factor, partial [Candidatus Dormibacteraeota bacterium]
MDRLRVMIVDDHEMIVQALVLALGREPDMEVVATAHTARDAIVRVAESSPEVLLIDYRLPDATGADAVRRLARPDLRIVFLSADSSDSAMLAALEVGACGYLLKSEPLDNLVAAVRRAGEGEILLRAGELVSLLGRERAREREEAERQRVAASLTAREREILELMAQGLDNRAIADLLHLA